MASDGQWYPPQAQPAAPPPPVAPTPQPPQAPQAGQPMAAPAFQQVPTAPVPAPNKKGMSGWAIAGLVGGFFLLTLLGGCVAFVLIAKESVEDVVAVIDVIEEEIDAAVEEGTEAIEEGAAAVEDAENPFDGPDDDTAATDLPDEVVDEADPSNFPGVSGCGVDDDKVSVEITNNSGEQATFWVSLSLFDASGDQVGDQTIIAQYVPQSEVVNYSQTIFSSDDVASCEVTGVEQFAAISNGSIDQGECLVTGVDSFDDLTAAVVITNDERSEIAGASISVVFVRDGVQFADTSLSIGGLAPGETAPGQIISSIDGPADGVECQVVSIDFFGYLGEDISSLVSCTVVDDETIVLQMTNDSGTKLSIAPVVVYYDEAGQRLSDDSYFMSNVRPGEELRVEFSSFGNDGSQCEVVASNSNEPFEELPADEATCEVTGVDSFDDLEVLFTIQNITSEVGDFDLVGALIDGGVRIGESTAFIAELAPGDSASKQGFSTTEGSPDSVTCEVVYFSN